MSDTVAASTETAAKPRGSMLPMVMVIAVSSILGTAIPVVMQMSGGNSEHGTAPDGHGDSHAASTFSATGDSAYVPFDQVVVNLDEGRLTRYLRLAVTLQIESQASVDFNQRLTAKKLILKNWLLSHVSDKTLDDIRGAVGQNRLRREIRDHFNSVLYPEGYDRIYDVLFDEFNIQ